jgi:hypothetical protein
MAGKVTEESGAAAEPVLLSGGNPQIAKADGDAPVQAYIAAMPGWKSDVGRRLDGIVARTVPDVRKAVRWNSPFYGMEGQGWFLNFHVRYLDIYEDDQFDQHQFAAWVKQASQLPGWGKS